MNRRPSTDEATADTEASSERRVGTGAVVTKSLSRFPHARAEELGRVVSLMEAAGIVRVTVYSEFDSVQAARDAVRILGDSGYPAEYTRKDESKTYAVVARASTEAWSAATETVRGVAYQLGGTRSRIGQSESAAALL